MHRLQWLALGFPLLAIQIWVFRPADGPPRVELTAPEATSSVRLAQPERGSPEAEVRGFLAQAGELVDTVCSVEGDLTAMARIRWPDGARVDGRPVDYAAPILDGSLHLRAEGRSAGVLSLEGYAPTRVFLGDGSCHVELHRGRTASMTEDQPKVMLF